MAINTTPKEMPTGDGNPTAGGAINDLDFPTGERNDKAFSRLRAAFELRGHSLHRTDPADGKVTYWVERWGLVRYLPTLHDAAQFLAQIGGRL
ncbi:MULTISPECIES: hypothetical protein [unclassified Hydrogenophaga]|uniref:hypothetical protein n=1 Tax=unclassified Hydrogenophaga TaxID=2610897 RepID=UPI0008783D3F|nr:MULTISPECIES: hypothetical protein [unclassified Hydrogenophaga]MBN9371563.1 hypothetical protein [Hydrogenophaga sp.]OJV55742.1 MAG: hypothetical protein BGO22_09565 [Hydrogenophaga sp. 70-12]